MEKGLDPDLSRVAGLVILKNQSCIIVQVIQTSLLVIGKDCLGRQVAR